MSDKPPPRFASSPPKPSGPPIPRDEPEEESPLRNAVRRKPAVELPTPSPVRVGPATRRRDSGARALADTPVPARARVSPSMAPGVPSVPAAASPVPMSAPVPPPAPLPRIPAPAAAPSPSAPPRSQNSAPAPSKAESDPPPREPVHDAAREMAVPASDPPARDEPKTSSSPPAGRRMRKPWNDAEWQKLWLATQQKTWRSIAIVAGSPGMSTSPFEVATALADVGWQHLGRPITVVDARETTLGHVETRISDVASKTAKGERVILVLSSIFDNPATLALAEAADAVVLCILLGQSQMTRAEETVEKLGRERFLGSVVLRDPTRAPSPPPGKADS